MTAWRQCLPVDAWTHVTVRDGEKGPVAVEMVNLKLRGSGGRKLVDEELGAQKVAKVTAGR